MNITPLFAIAILLPSITSNQRIQYGIPLSLMLFKDVFLGRIDDLKMMFLCKNYHYDTYNRIDCN